MYLITVDKQFRGGKTLFMRINDCTETFDITPCCYSGNCESIKASLHNLSGHFKSDSTKAKILGALLGDNNADNNTFVTIHHENNSRQELLTTMNEAELSASGILVYSTFVFVCLLTRHQAHSARTKHYRPGAQNIYLMELRQNI